MFVDECGTHVSLAPIYGYSPKGKRVCLKVPRNRGKNTTLLASIREPSAFTVWMPFALGLTYVVLPDAFPVLPFDDAAAAGGAIATFALWLCTAAIATPCCR